MYRFLSERKGRCSQAEEPSHSATLMALVTMSWELEAPHLTFIPLNRLTSFQA
jgi:hypothetical protein